MKLWGKSMNELDEEHRNILAQREARALGERYAGAVNRQFHFGTDIPAPTMAEVEMGRAKIGADDTGPGAMPVIVLAFLLAAVVAIIIRSIV